MPFRHPTRIREALTDYFRSRMSEQSRGVIQELKDQGAYPPSRPHRRGKGQILEHSFRTLGILLGLLFVAGLAQLFTLGQHPLKASGQRLRTKGRSAPNREVN